MKKLVVEIIENEIGNLIYDIEAHGFQKVEVVGLLDHAKVLVHKKILKETKRKNLIPKEKPFIGVDPATGNDQSGEMIIRGEDIKETV